MASSAPHPDKIGRYQILEQVGRGGMGVLYRGHDPVLDREVAVKVMLTDFAEDFELLRPRFYREAKAVARLQHRNIVTIFEFAEESNQPHIVMEFLRGQPLGDRMRARPPLTLDDKLDIVAQLCAGLSYAHSQGVVHRDVKPANVFLLTDGTVKLLDFGIAKLTTSTLTRQGDVLGSASYMSPEQVSGSEAVDGRADVWSTGVVLYELLAGRRPFEGDSPAKVIVKILKEDPEPIESCVPDLPDQLAALLGRALEKDREQRIPRAEDFGRELQWIRKALVASGDLPPMEETRYASTHVLKALHEDRQKQSSASVGRRTLAPPEPNASARRSARAVPVVPVPAAASRAAAAEPTIITGSNKTVLIAALTTAVVIGGGGAALWLGGWGAGGGTTTSTVTSPPAASNPAPSPTSPGTPPPPAPAAPDSKPPMTVKMLPADPGGKPGSPASTSPPPAPKTAKPPAAAGEAAAKPTPKNPPASATEKPDPPPSKPAAPSVTVSVTMAGAYPFQVLEGSRVVSETGTAHDFQHANGRMLRVVAPEVFLDQAVRVDGGADRAFDYRVPGLGVIDIRATRGDCRVMIGKRDLGFLPLPPVRVVAGDYEVSLSCPDGVNPRNTTTVTQGFTARVLFK